MASDRANDPRRVANLEVAQSVAGIDDQSRPAAKYRFSSSEVKRKSTHKDFGDLMKDVGPRGGSNDAGREYTGERGAKRDRSKDLGQVKRDRKAANAGGAVKTPKKQRKATEAVVTKFNAYRREIARRPAHVKGFMPQSDGGNTWPVKSRTAKQRASSGTLKKGKK